MESVFASGIDELCKYFNRRDSIKYLKYLKVFMYDPMEDPRTTSQQDMSTRHRA